MTRTHYELEFVYTRGDSPHIHYTDMSESSYPEKENIIPYLKEKYTIENVVEIGKMYKIETTTTEIEY